MSDVPCPTCPWRKTSTVGGFDIPNFDIDKMRGLRSCFGDGEDGFFRVMACHYSTCGGETPCIGYVAVAGWQNILVRIMAADGKLDIGAILDACDGLDLWPDFESMLAAYETAIEGAT